MTIAVRPTGPVLRIALGLIGSPPVVRMAKPSTAFQKLMASQPKFSAKRMRPAQPRMLRPPMAITCDMSPVVPQTLPMTRIDNAARLIVRTCRYAGACSSSPRMRAANAGERAFVHSRARAFLGLRQAVGPSLAQRALAQAEICAHLDILASLRREGEGGAPRTRLELSTAHIGRLPFRNGDDRLDRHSLGQARELPAGKVDPELPAAVGGRTPRFGRRQRPGARADAPSRRRQRRHARPGRQAIGERQRCSRLDRLLRDPVRDDVVVDLGIARDLDQLDGPASPIALGLDPEAGARFETLDRILILTEVRFALDEAEAFRVLVEEVADAQPLRIEQGARDPLVIAPVHQDRVAVMHLGANIDEGPVFGLAVQEHRVDGSEAKLPDVEPRVK